MERLVTTSQAAEILGISLQGVHYRIKKNQLRSLKQAGKTFVYVNDSDINSNSTNSQIPLIEEVRNELNTFEKVLEAKDEQIDLLKKSIKWMRNQYESEIKRLDKNQKRMLNVFDSEIKLLQGAFNEMKTLYKPKILENPLAPPSSKEKFITLLDFTMLMKTYGKNDKEIKLIVLKAIKNGDKRFLYNKEKKKVLILNEDFSDFK